MKNNLLVFLGFALICLVNLSSSKPKDHPAPTPVPTLVPAADEVSGSNGPGIVREETVPPLHSLPAPTSITK